MTQTKQPPTNPARFIVLGIVGFCGTLGAVWASDTPQIQAAVVGGLFTLLAAAGGALIVFYQLRRQAQNAIDANRRSEVMKLKKDIYEEADLVITEAEKAQVALKNSVLRSVFDIETIQGGMPQWTPRISYDSLDKAYDQWEVTSAAMSSIIDKWRVADRVMQDFIEPVYWARRDVNHAYFSYLGLVVRVIPSSEGKPHQISTTAPPAESLVEIKKRASELTEFIVTLNFFSHDLRTELQNILLAELFGRSTPRRAPSDVVPTVLRIDQEKELQRYVQDRKDYHARTEDDEGARIDR